MRLAESPAGTGGPRGPRPPNPPRHDEHAALARDAFGGPQRGLKLLRVGQHAAASFSTVSTTGVRLTASPELRRVRRSF
jgi:hypothetical protein